jgi:hypothetical protein
MIEDFDKQEGYCKILGHFLTFDYCRSSNKSLPCAKVLDCWFRQFPVEKYIAENYSPEEHAKMFEPPKSKVLSLTEILEQAQKRLKENK